MTSRLLLKTPPRASCVHDVPPAEETMGLASRLTGGLVLGTITVFLSAHPVFAQEHAGVVTTLEGMATVSRGSLPELRLLKFKDDVYIRDRITTGDRSLVRVLLGGKATVTARERSVLTITEIPGVSTVYLDEGRISVAVSKGLMKPGEVIEIKTPNAVSAIRGTVVVAEVFPEGMVRSTISVLRGLVDVTRLETGQRVGLPVNVGALQAITVTGSIPLTQPRAITADDAKQLFSEFRIVPRALSSTATAPAVEAAIQYAVSDAASAAAAHKAGGKGESSQGHQDAASAREAKKHGDGNDDEGDKEHNHGKEKDSAKSAAHGKGKGKEHRNDISNSAVPTSDSSPGAAAAGGNGETGAVTAPTGNSAQTSAVTASSPGAGPASGNSVTGAVTTPIGNSTQGGTPTATGGGSAISGGRGNSGSGTGTSMSILDNAPGAGASKKSGKR